MVFNLLYRWKLKLSFFPPFSNGSRSLLTGKMNELSAAETKPVRQLVGFDNFKRCNPFSDKFGIEKFHSLEFYCNDATNVSRRFMWGLG